MSITDYECIDCGRIYVAGDDNNQGCSCGASTVYPLEWTAEDLQLAADVWRSAALRMAERA
jgi:predicted  nucleic acid-binding Zn-ribbon protein